MHPAPNLQHPTGCGARLWADIGPAPACGHLRPTELPASAPRPHPRLKLPQSHLSPYLGHLCRMIGTGLEKAAQEGPCGNPADEEGAAGEQNEIL